MRARLPLVVTAALIVSAATVVAPPAQASVSVNLAAGVVTFTSDGADDTITITCQTTTLFLNGMSTGQNCGNDVVVLGGGGDDVIDVTGLSTGGGDDITVDAGEGNDRVEARQFASGTLHEILVTGGDGNDVLVGTDVDSLKGGPGNDRLSDFGYVGNLLDGESGNDTYAFDFAPIASNIALDLTPLGGGLVVQIGGGPGQFFPWGSIEALDLTMNSGSNVVNGFAFQGPITVQGGGGNDTLVGGDAADSLDGGVGDDTIEGGEGADSVAGGDGGDVLRMADGLADTVTCGSGNDIVVADPIDALAGCESVQDPPGEKVKPVPGVAGAKLKGRVVSVSVRCPTTELRCVGELVLKATGKRGGTTRKATVGRALFVANGGVRKVVRLTVSRATAQAIRSWSKPKLKVTYDLMDAAGNVAKGTKTVPLKIVG